LFTDRITRNAKINSVGGKGKVKVTKTVVRIITILLFKGNRPNISFTGPNLAGGSYV